MDKVKMTYPINGKEYRLQDPEHFYAWVARDSVRPNLGDRLPQYLREHPEKLEEVDL